MEFQMQGVARGRRPCRRRKEGLTSSHLFTKISFTVLTSSSSSNGMAIKIRRACLSANACGASLGRDREAVTTTATASIIV